MVYLLLAILGSALISIIMRVSERYISNNMSLLTVNYMTCSLLAALFSGPSQLFPRLDGLGIALLLGAVSGVLYLTSFLLLQWNVAKNGVVLAATFMKLGVLVPTLMSVLLFGEKPGLSRILGCIGALAAILLIHFEGGGTRAGSRGALLLLLLVGGLTDATAKVFEQLGASALNDQYLFYTFLTALVLGVVLILLKKQRLGKMEVLFGVLIGIPNYLCSRFLLLSLNSVPAVAAYPTYSVGTIVVVTCAGLLFFREKISRRRGIALGIILVALVLLNR